jgi:hypothetical protein
MGPQNSPKGVNKLSTEEKATIIAFRKAGMKTHEIVVRTGHNAISNTHTLAAARELGGQGVQQRKKGPGRPRKVISSVLKSLKRQISKYSIRQKNVHFSKIIFFFIPANESPC